MSDETWKRYCDACHELRALRQKSRVGNRRQVAFPATPVPEPLNVSQDALRAGGSEANVVCPEMGTTFIDTKLRGERPHSKGR
jgi:hypothetical protein